ncbi:MAG: class I SAM-dependent methyltransferase [Myxococcota bacterium]|nr:class I SAM-dependent methyltransferase [Myxococcota bacterium]
MTAAPSQPRGAQAVREPGGSTTATGPSSSAPSPESTSVQLGPVEAAVFETFVVPRYLSLFGDLALELLVASEDARVAHLDCRTGYPDRAIALKLAGAHIIGVDPSAAALELARAKAATMPEMVSRYTVCEGLPTSLPSFAFSHALSLHPMAGPEQRAGLFRELARLLGPHGQALVAMPIRASFQELIDLLREYALKHDDSDVLRAVDRAALVPPTVEELGVELRDANFDFVDIGLRTATLCFQSGRDFFEDPVARLLILPQLAQGMALGDGGEGSRRDRAFAYVRDAIDKYWSESTFDLTVNVGCATGRRIP